MQARHDPRIVERAQVVARVGHVAKPMTFIPRTRCFVCREPIVHAGYHCREWCLCVECALHADLRLKSDREEA